MVATVTDYPPNRSGVLYRVATEETDAPIEGDWHLFGTGPVTVGIGGAASAYTVQVWRSFRDPTGFSAVMVAGALLTGAGGEEAPTVYQEDAIGYWRVEVVSVADNTVITGISGSIP